MAADKVSPDDCVDMLKALADEHRWRMVQTLLSETLSVGELGERLGIPQYNVSKHLAVLRESGIVVTERDGKTVQCSIAPGFRARLRSNDCRLDLGCCAFDFNKASAR